MNSSAQGYEALLARLRAGDGVIGVIGLGYVGVPLSLAACAGGFRVVGFDIDEQKVALLNAGKCYIKHIDQDEVAAYVGQGRFRATADFGELTRADAILICVPTPLTRHREPDLRFVEDTVTEIARTLRAGQLVVLESTTYPGTTSEVVRPILEKTGLACGQDFFLGFSPEREDPGNQVHTTRSIPKVIGAEDAQALALTEAVYGRLFKNVVPVSSTATAEAVKLTENIFRAVNIALVNELKVIYSAMGIDIWEVINAAKTKPFGFMPFYPGPGLGGHCIPIDPFYLTWKARELEISTRFIELAGEINTAMPAWVIEQLAIALDRHSGRGLTGARILIAGLAYKKNVDDIRESPSFKLIELLEKRGAHADYFDPYVSSIPMTREHAALAGRQSVSWEKETLARYDVVLISTDHDCVDYELLRGARLVVDTRNACAARGIAAPHIIKA